MGGGSFGDFHVSTATKQANENATVLFGEKLSWVGEENEEREGITRIAAVDFFELRKKFF